MPGTGDAESLLGSSDDWALVVLGAFVHDVGAHLGLCIQSDWRCGGTLEDQQKVEASV